MNLIIDLQQIDGPQKNEKFKWQNKKQFNMNLLIDLSGLLLTILVFITACYYTLWKSYENAGLNAFLKVDTFWNFEAKKSDNKEIEEIFIKNAEKLLQSANHLRWLYNSNWVIVKRLFRSTVLFAVFLFLSLVLMATFSTKFSSYLWLFFILVSVFIFFYLLDAYRVFKIIRDRGEQGDLSIDKFFFKKGKFNPLDPILNERFERLKESVKGGQPLKWFDDNENIKGHY